MVNFETLDVEKDLSPSWKFKRGVRRAKRDHRPHILKKFFRERSVPNYKIAAVMQVTPMTVSHWLNVDYPAPPDREQQLWLLHDKIKEWEGRNGRRFGFYKL